MHPATTWLLVACLRVTLPTDAVAVFSCPSLELCSCTSDKVDCVCPRGDEDLDLFALFETDVRVISVRHCGSVLVPPYLVAGLSLDELSISDVRQLKVRALAFEGVDRLGALRIRRIDSLVLEQFALHGIREATLVELSSVTLDEVPTAAISGLMGIDEIHLRNSHLGTLRSMALLLANASLFRMENCTIASMHNASLVADSISSVQLVNSTFADTDQGALVLHNVSRVLVSGCRFGELRHKFLQAQLVDTFVFERNVVALVGRQSLRALSSLPNVTVSHNAFQQVDSLPTGPGVVVSNNSFTCDCRLSWMWEAPRSLLSAGSCASPGPLQGAALSLLRPEPPNGPCARLERAPRDTEKHAETEEHARATALTGGVRRPLPLDFLALVGLVLASCCVR
ncbi:unnamed protein product [Ixodes hexagonus]